MTTVNRAVREHLQRISDTERQKTLRVLVLLRAVFTTLYSLNLGYHTLQGEADSRAVLKLFIAYAAISIVVAVSAELWPTLLRSVGFTLGLVDIPMVISAATLAVPELSRPEYVLNSLLPFLAVIIVFSTLALDYRAIALTTVSAAIGAALIVRNVGEPWSEVEDPVMAMFGAGALCSFLVSRLRALVEESRRKDFAGKYILGDRIGSGGMAEVFAATYSPEGSFERRVAVKRVLPAYANNLEFIALFRREAELGALLAHPNLVQVFDFGRHLDSWFLAMELIEGVSLGDVMKAQKGHAPMPISVCLYIIAEVAEGLSYLHEKHSNDGTQVGLLHRDLNPPNILLSASGEVKVSDFGVARWTSAAELTQVGTLRGKVAYMAPEHLRGAPPSLGGDIFALGVMAHELLTGARLFRGNSDPEIALSVMESSISPPSLIRTEVPPEVEALVMSMVERDPAHRATSARSVAKTLRNLEGPHAPYPSGRTQLIEILKTVKPQHTGVAAVSTTVSTESSVTKTTTLEATRSG